MTVWFTDDFKKKCNNIFETDVSDLCFPLVFDVYDSKKEFEEAVEKPFEEPFEDLKKCGVAEIIDGKYVYLNECNLDLTDEDVMEW